jgi:hypothetical protein
LESKLVEQNESIAEMQTDRSRKLEKESLQSSIKAKETEYDKSMEIIDTEYSEQQRKLKAHEVLISKSFKAIKDQFPELFNELTTNTNDFFEVFKSYEEKFGDHIGDASKKLKEEILPNIESALDMVLKANQSLDQMLGQMPLGNKKGIDYSEVTFDPKKDYQGEINKLMTEGFTREDPYIQELIAKRAKKIMINPNSTASQWATIDTDFAMDKNSTAYTQMMASSEVNKISNSQPKVNPYSSSEIAIEKVKLKIGEVQRNWLNTKDTKLSAIGTVVTGTLTTATLTLTTTLFGPLFHKQTHRIQTLCY